MGRRNFVVEYRDVLMRAGEQLHLPQVRGILTVCPAPDCDAKLLTHGQTVKVKQDRTLFIAQKALTVTAGTLSGDLIFCGNAKEPCI